MANYGVIPEQVAIPWATAFVVSWAGLKRRFLPSMLTMVGAIPARPLLAHTPTPPRSTHAPPAVSLTDLLVPLRSEARHLHDDYDRHGYLLLFANGCSIGPNTCQIQCPFTGCLRKELHTTRGLRSRLARRVREPRE